MSMIIGPDGLPIAPPTPELPLPIVERAIDTSPDLAPASDLAKIEVTDQKVEFITDDQFIKARPWPCCQRPLLIRMITDDDKKERPLVALCDKKAGHTGLHRGRADNKTYIWRSRAKSAH